MRLLLLTIFTAVYQLSAACSCDPLQTSIQEDVGKTDYIAFVRIKQILPVKPDSSRNFDPFNHFRIVVEELNHFKGERLSEIIVTGGNEKLKTSSSCDLGMEEGSEWVIFAQYVNGAHTVYPCGRTTAYRWADGFRDWEYERGIGELAFLNAYFKKAVVLPGKKEGVVRTYFPNGMVEKVEHYKDNKLDGDVEYYFPSGVLYGKSTYKNGQLHGKSYWNHRDGVLSKEAKYSNNVKVDTSILYVRTVNGNRPSMVSIFNKKGEQLRFQEFGGNYQERYLTQENLYEPDTKKLTRIFYFRNGRISYIEHEVNGKFCGEHISYDEQGNIKRITKYDDNGQIIR